MFPMIDRVKVCRYFWWLTIEINNFAFVVQVILGLESTILKGRTDGEAENRTSYSPVEAGTGAELGNESCSTT